jgi:hypothetical protein
MDVDILSRDRNFTPRRERKISSSPTTRRGRPLRILSTEGVLRCRFSLSQIPSFVGADPGMVLLAI